jgi:hypothetical protein
MLLFKLKLQVYYGANSWTWKLCPMSNMFDSGQRAYHTFELRTKEAMRSCYLQAQSPELTAAEKDIILKKVGLRDVEVG